MILEWADPERFEFTCEEITGRGVVLVQRRVGLRHRRRTVKGTGLLWRFLLLGETKAGPQACLKFLRRFGPWGDARDVPVCGLMDLAQGTAALLRVAAALRVADRLVRPDDRRRLAAWARSLPEGTDPSRPLGAAVDAAAAPAGPPQSATLDLTPFYPRDRYRLDPEDPDPVIPAQTLTLGTTIGPGPDDPHSYAVPATIEVHGPDAIDAWLKGLPTWHGNAPAGGPTRLSDADLLEETFEATWRQVLPVSRVRWMAESNRFEWNAPPLLGVHEAVAVEVARALVQGDYGVCRTCGGLFQRPTEQRGRPRSQCERCFDPNTSSRRAAARAAARRRTAAG